MDTAVGQGIETLKGETEVTLQGDGGGVEYLVDARLSSSRWEVSGGVRVRH